MASSNSRSHSPGPTETTVPDEDHGVDLPHEHDCLDDPNQPAQGRHAGLADIEELDNRKVNVRFQAVGPAPILRQKVFKVSASQKFETVVNFLRKVLKCKPTDSVFLYVNSVFAPGLDEGVGNLYRCFKTDDQLIVAYSMTPAFG